VTRPTVAWLPRLGHQRDAQAILSAVSTPGPRRDFSAYFGGSVAEFLAAPQEAVIGRLALADAKGAVEAEQLGAWAEEVEILRKVLVGLEGTLFLEFDVPRLGSRLDAALVSGAAVFPIEFKCGERRFTTDAYNQVWDYALDLKNFHRASHAAPIFPILVATRATDGATEWQPSHDDGVRPPRRATPTELRMAIDDAIAQADGPPLDGDAWGRSAYQPTPTIIEAARALYTRHTVDAITRNDAGAKNLQVTSGRVEEIIEGSRARHEKAIVFVTGVPGAGKTLVGLNVATRRRTFGDARAVFLSGNGPLVAVLQEALTRDEFCRQHGATRKGVIRQQVKPFIQNVQHFRDDGVRTSAPPYDHVVIFDEAQRA